MCRVKLIVILVGVICLFKQSVVVAVEKNLDRTLEKLAASLIREHPQFKGEQRLSTARSNLVKEFKALGADEISSEKFKKIKRHKVDYQSYFWKSMLKRYEKANFTDPKMKFFLGKAKAEKMRGEEHYVVNHLMRKYYALEIEKRTSKARKSLSQLGKKYTDYVKIHDKPPKDLRDLEDDPNKRAGMNPLTGIISDWIYIGAGPAEIRGSNRYRVIGYAPFESNDAPGYHWVVYKGGLLGSWQSKTLQSAIKKMHIENEEVEIRKIAQAKQNDSKKISMDQDKKKREKSLAESTSKPKLKITIKELW